MKKTFLLLTLFVFSARSFSQCAMCKATAESSGVANGLNEGILYIMIIPYLLLGGFIAFILRKKIASFYKQLFKKETQTTENFTAENWY